MKLSKILIPTLSIASVATPVCLTACTTVKQDNTHFTTSEEKTIETPAGLWGYENIKFTPQETEIKASDYKVTMELISTSSYIHIIRCVPDIDTNDFIVHIEWYSDQEACQQEEDQKVEFNIKIQYKQEWYHLEEGYSIVVKKA